MTIAPTLEARQASEVTITGTVRSPLMLVRRIYDRQARVSFRVGGEDGPYNVHTTGSRAELLRLTLHKGDRVTVHAPRTTISHPHQTIPDLEADGVELHFC